MCCVAVTACKRRVISNSECTLINLTAEETREISMAAPTSVSTGEGTMYTHNVPLAQVPSATGVLDMPIWPYSHHHSQASVAARLEVTAIRLALVCLCGKDTDKIPACERLSIRVLT